MPTDRPRQETAGLGFRLPLNITVTRQLLPKGMAYVFRDFELGELGRLAVESTPTGETQIVSEVAGDAADPMTQRRLELLEPICRELTSILESVKGQGRAAPLPVRTPYPRGKVPCEEVRCDACGQMVAFLVFVDGATDEGRFEDYARQMYPHYARNNVPTYLIGPALGSGPMEHRPANILKVWPQRSPMECLQPEEFNPRLIELSQRHCR
ncbi:hypothetical protein [Polaromonas hydrogenivorans]|uniref:Uncharacterized protein n=1 Tax=Polaromonas hydrogenivorans TaxID=335476 RepID=A0AAU7M0E0_9BURK